MTPTGPSRGAPDVVDRQARRRARLAFGIPAGWWPVAFTSEIGAKPVGLHLGAVPLALYRDATGAVRAVEDRCPHRRMPLSMGWVTAEGHLQCPYHGWCFDGTTGQCAEIPNLRADETVSPSIKVAVAPAAERVLATPEAVLGEVEGEVAAMTMADADVGAGFVHVWTGDEEPQRPPEMPGAAAPYEASPGAAAKIVERRIDVRAPFDRALAAVALNPGRALGLGFLLGSGDEVVGPCVQPGEGWISVERERLRLDAPRVVSYDSIVRQAVPSRIQTSIVTGFTVITTAGPSGTPDVRIFVGFTPLDPYRTTVRWRAELSGSAARAAVAAGLLTAAGAVRQLFGRTEIGIEALADRIDDTPDPVVRTLRRR